MIKIAIVEDEKIEQERLLNSLCKFKEEYADFNYSVTVFNDGVQFLSSFKAEYDLIFLDISMPHINGMDVAAKIRERDENVLIVFITNLQQYALKGYQVDAMDFAVKPLKYSRFASIMRRVAKKVTNSKKNICIGAGGNIKRILVSGILYVEVMAHELTYHTVSGDFSVRSSMKDAEKQLIGEGFYRCNNCYLVNLLYVKAVESDEVIVGDSRLKIALRRKSEFLRALAAYKGI